MTTDVFVLTDRSGVIQFWSPGAERAFGHLAARAVGDTLDLLIPAELRDAHWAGFRRAVEASAADLEGQSTPFPVCCADGSVRETPGRLTLVRGPVGDVAAVMVVFAV